MGIGTSRVINRNSPPPKSAFDAIVSGGSDTAIQAAIDGLTSGRDYQERVLLIGDFTVTDAIDVPSYTFIEIRGKITQAVGGTEAGMFRNSDAVGGNSNITIQGGFLVGEVARLAYQSGIYMDNVDTLLIDNVNISGMKDHGIDLVDEVTNFVVQNCICSANGDDGITVHAACSGGVIFNNICSGGLSVGSGGSASSTGIEVECEGSTAPSNVSILNNVCHTNKNGVQVIVDSTAGTATIKNILIANNNCYSNTVNGMSITGRDATRRVINSTITDNVCDANTQNGLFIGWTEGTNYKGNIISNNGTLGVTLQNSNYTTLSSNTIIDNDEHGIRAYNTCTYTRIEDNTILDNGQAATGYGIRLGGDCDTTVYNNTIGNTGGAATPQYGLNLADSAGDVDIHDNKFIDARDISGDAIYAPSLSGNPVRISNNPATTAIDCVTEARGSGTISVGTTVAITHGIWDQWTMPASAIKITPTGGSGAMWVTAIGTTTFTVNGTNGDTFDWEVDGKKV